MRITYINTIDIHTHKHIHACIHFPTSVFQWPTIRITDFGKLSQAEHFLTPTCILNCHSKFLYSALILSGLKKCLLLIFLFWLNVFTYKRVSSTFVLKPIFAYFFNDVSLTSLSNVCNSFLVIYLFLFCII